MPVVKKWDEQWTQIVREYPVDIQETPVCRGVVIYLGQQQQDLNEDRVCLGDMLLPPSLLRHK